MLINHVTFFFLQSPQKDHIPTKHWVRSARCICIACFIPISEGKPLIGQFKHSPPWCIAPAVYWPIRGNEIVCLHSWGDAYASCRTYPLFAFVTMHLYRAMNVNKYFAPSDWSVNSGGDASGWWVFKPTNQKASCRNRNETCDANASDRT